MTDDRYLQFCEWFIGRWQDIADNMDRELRELEDFRTGKRTSRHPLGSVFFGNRGHELQSLMTEMERWEHRDVN